MAELRPVRELVNFYIGGGWGSDTPSEGLEEVAIIRGADFPRVAMGDASAVPLRWEESKKVARRALREGDLVLEISGGTKDRPTGRSIFISEGILQAHRVPVIPASFCRLVRPDSTQIVPRYLYYWLQDMYRDGRTWGYQVQSTGLANFNVEWFLDRELVRVRPLDEQRRIAEVLGALDDLIDTNERLAADAAELRGSLLDAAFALATEQHALSSIARFVNGKNFTKGADGDGRPIIRTPEVREGVKPSTVRSSVEATDDFIARAGDLLFVWSGSLCIGRWVEDEALVNQHVFKVVPNAGVPDWYVYACLEWKLPWFLGLAADKATTMGHIQRAHLDAPVPKLSSDELAHLDVSVRPLWELELEMSRENEQLRRTRDELLPLLMSGAVRVRQEGVAA